MKTQGRVNTGAMERGNIAEQKDTRQAALIVDLQSFAGMSPDDAKLFGEALGRKLTEFRQSGVQPVWIAIAPGGSKLLPPSSAEDSTWQVRDLQTLEEMGFDGFLPSSDNHEIYASFIQNFGPRNDEIVYRKPAMSALATIDDTNDMSRILEQAGVKLESQKNVTEDHPATRYISSDQQEAEFRNLFSSGLALHDYLAESNCRAVYILGAVSKYCVAETAISAAVKGYQAEIVPDMVLSWMYPVTGASRESGKLVWSGFDHRNLIEDTVTGALNDTSRSFTDDQKLKIAGIRFAGNKKTLLCHAFGVVADETTVGSSQYNDSTQEESIPSISPSSPSVRKDMHHP